MANENYSLFIM